MPDEDPERPALLDYAAPEPRLQRDPMSYYREPPAISEWTPAMLVFAIVMGSVVVVGGLMLLVAIVR
jgi:hypothetical protein